MFNELVAVCDAGPPPPPAGDVLLVVGNAASLTTGDAAWRDHLEVLNYDVTVSSDEDVTIAAADAADVVLVAATVSSSTVGASLNPTTTSMVVTKAWLYDDVGLTGPVVNIDYGNLTTDSATLVGPPPTVVTILSQPHTVGWGVPAPAATVIAIDAAFVYADGALLADGSTAAGCRAAFPASKTSAADHTGDGWTLFHDVLNACG